MVLWDLKKKKKPFGKKRLNYTSKEEDYPDGNEHLPQGDMRATDEQKGFVWVISQHEMTNTWSSVDLCWNNSIICGLSLGVVSNDIFDRQPKEND